jgi:hypothetical protein
MSLFHRHRWSEVGRAYTPTPVRGRTELNGPSESVERMTFGVTNIELRCAWCNARKFVSVAGKAERPCD